MKAFTEFLNRDTIFWAHIKYISEKLKYAERNTGLPRSYDINEIVARFSKDHFDTTHLFNDEKMKPTNYGKDIVKYLNKRRDMLNDYFEPNLMNREEAKVEFDTLRERIQPTCHLPYNKQKKEKRHYAYLTGMVNMLTEETLDGCGFDDNPTRLSVVVDDNKPVKTFARRFDGAYPSTKDPVAVWELKEYYGTTTFGSRVADGIYETMLDGMEIEKLHEEKGIDVKHYLIIDDKYTWWGLGKSYLCRIIDILHQGYLDEVIVGRDVITRWPEIVSDLKKINEATQ